MRKMKDSGIPWIGEIPEEWGIGRIGQLYVERKEKVSDINYPPLSVTMKGIVPQLSTAAKTDAHDDRKLVRKGDFAINSRSDRRGSCGISQYDGSVSLINTILAPRGEMNPVYYDWLFHSTMFSDEFYKWGHGIVDDLWTTNWQDMKRISIPIPSFQEQKRIADHLDAECARIDAVMEQTRTSIEEYNKLKQSIITEAVTKGIRPNRTTKEWNDFDTYIPDVWDLIRLKYLMIEIIDCPHETPVYSSDGEYYVIRTADQEYAKLRSDNDMYRLDTSEYKNRIRRLSLDKDDIVYGREGERWGLACLVPESEKYCLGQRMMQFRCDQRRILPMFAVYALSSANIHKQGEFDTFGSTSPHVNISTIRNYKLLVPNLAEQQEIVEYLDRITDQINFLIKKKEQYLLDLESYKKSLIFEYITGKKEVV